VFAGGRGEWSIALYDIVKNNLQVSIPDQPGERQQVGQQSSRGVEVSASLGVTDNLQIDANVAVLDANFDDFAETVGGAVISRNGNTPPNVAQRTANLWINWHALPQWYFRGGIRFIGERYADNA